MKKLFYLFFLSFVLFSCSNEDNSEVVEQIAIADDNYQMKNGPCPPGTSGVLVHKFNYIRLHRPSTDCMRGFSVCSDGMWLIECWDMSDERFPVLVAEAPLDMDWQAKSAQVVAVPDIENKLIDFYISKEIENAEGFETEDFDVFAVEEDWEISEDITVKAGEYQITRLEYNFKIVADIY
ncbi:hypothetical protein E0W68_13590 [Flavobacterium salilacus subsp. salilacus]|uniref:hypothetical protein n=1 Tax=Flavobacterium TaxID=237 RepID=UPI001074B955|nr:MULTISPECIES: hypothetical protein [Flavobacterium]KAF2514501.1 hypothetical protein E0W68_13590 [Flavobacterium salilacus subsp. salilacus]MBE1615930.1 hypothetical protein [Flavobacterium sp. SaA2.13]